MSEEKYTFPSFIKVSVRRSVLRLLANSGETFLELVTSLSTATLKNVTNPFPKASEVENIIILSLPVRFYIQAVDERCRK